MELVHSAKEYEEVHNVGNENADPRIHQCQDLEEGLTTTPSLVTQLGQ